MWDMRGGPRARGRLKNKMVNDSDEDITLAPAVRTTRTQMLHETSSGWAWLPGSCLRSAYMCTTCPGVKK